MNRQLWLGIGLAVALAGGVLATRLSRPPPAAVEIVLTDADAAFPLAGADLELELTPRPIRPMQPFALRLRAARGATITDAHVSFNMKMDMGKHDYALVSEGGALWARDIVLPTCPSGGRLWFGDLSLTLDDAPAAVRLVLELQPSEGS